MIAALLDSLRDARRRKIWEPSQAAGRRGEDLAHRYLRKQGYVIVARNYRLPSGDGEADIVAWDGDILVIVEVKSRESGAYGPPDRAIDPEKLRHMRRIALEYGSKTDTPQERIRFDVVTVLLGERPQINLFRGVNRR
ncbi:MAG: YraN family protein [Bryobacterales bacterium]|nr:YraN family protein [Bryobacterales bacterium]MBV9396422.1 YraN family protein [Bryobacterales bacterium]